LTDGGGEMPKHSRRYLDARKSMTDGGPEPVARALRNVKQAATAKFDETVECAIKLAVNPSKGEESVRGSTVLPHGTGKVPRVAVFAKGDAAREAEQAGADRVGGEELVEHPEMMKTVGRLGKKLGPRMPSKKAGNITTDVGAAVRDLKAGRVEFKMDKGAVLHVPIGKASFEAEQLEENLLALLDAVVRARPAAVKGRFIDSIHVASTMGPGVRVDIADALAKVGR
jgi:large subunit ribosomal protein L1